jgi:hypothetical protein
MTLMLSILNTKIGNSDHMESLHKSGQLSNMVIFKAPRQIGGENSHATDPGKQKGSHFLESENRDCMPSSCQGKLSHATDPGKPKSSHFLKSENRDSMPSADWVSKAGKATLGKPKAKGGSTEGYVKEEVHPIDKTRLSEKGSRFGNTKKKLQLSWSLRAPYPHIRLALFT